MTFEVVGAINSLSDYIISIPGVGAIMSNPIYTALFIAVIIALITLFIFRNAETDESLGKMCLRSGFYVFIILIGIIFLQNRVLEGEIAHVRRGSEIERVFNGSYSGYNAADESLIPVDINVDFTV